MAGLLLALVWALLCPRHAAASDVPPAAAPLQIRGTLPWHNFLSGPTAWDEADWVQYLDRRPAYRLRQDRRALFTPDCNPDAVRAPLAPKRRCRRAAGKTPVTPTP